MGIMLKYACDGCGYQTKELLIGPGSEPDVFNPRLVSCASCKTLRVVDVREVAGGCRKHRKPFSLHPEETDVPCPRCGQTLMWEPGALWD